MPVFRKEVLCLEIRYVRRKSGHWQLELSQTERLASHPLACLFTLDLTSAHSALSGLLNIFLLGSKEIWAFEVNLHIIIVSKAKKLEDKKCRHEVDYNKHKKLFICDTQAIYLNK